MLELGQNAPEFTLSNSEGNEISLIDFRGKKVILWFYPKASTPGWTVQGQGFRDEFKKFEDKNTIILGVSIDPPERHQRFIDKYNLPFDLIADENKKIAERYGVWKQKKLYGKTFMGIVRSTFVIDKNGIIAHIIYPVDVSTHNDIILSTLDSLTVLNSK